MFGLVNQVDYW